MKKAILTTLLGLGLLAPTGAEEKKSTEKSKAEATAKHNKGTETLADDQDSISADVQELLDEQTNAKVIELLSQVETLMAETINRLDEQNTSGETIAIQTEIIEKIYEAAKKKNEASGSKPNSEAMLEMMQQMMGKGDKPGDKPGKKPGEKPGQGQTAESDAANNATGGPSKGKTTERRVPKSAGRSGAGLPPEFQKALDAYRKTAPKK